jgi:NADH-quinone oxidoreductase subunit J
MGVRLPLGAYNMSEITLTLITNIIELMLIGAGVLVVSSLNSVHSVLWLVMVYINGGILFILMQAGFIALIFLIVYVGAISILFLFVIMMLNLRDLRGILDMSNYIPAGFLIGIVCFFEIVVFLNLGPYLFDDCDYLKWYFIEEINNIQALGRILYTNYAFLFILASFILLIALIGAMVITGDKKNKGGLVNRVTNQKF